MLHWSRAKPGFFVGRTLLHPSVRIIYLLTLAFAVYALGPRSMLVLMAALAGLLLYFRAGNFLNMLKRMRWLFLFLMIIYAFNTPGEYVRNWPVDLAPTYEGLQAGLWQVGKIAAMLAGVALLLKTTSRNSLMAGFFLLMYPLKWIGLHPERLAVRLWLTLHYVEQTPPARSIAAFLNSLDKVDRQEASSEMLGNIQLDIPRLSWRDMAAVLLLIVVGELL
ncbi:MAG TPA: CbiQ family ECF transporter T component [Methylophilaceae bacterium]|nr:CbiQ family ECF transporter T component [Methylophilaceae bacterium]